MAYRPNKLNSTSGMDDVLDLGSIDQRRRSVQDYGRFERMWTEIKFPVLWSTIAFLSLGLVVYIGTTERGHERLAALPSAIASLVGQAGGQYSTQFAGVIDREVSSLKEETRRLVVERTKLEARMALLEREVNDVTGSVRRNDSTASISSAPRRESDYDSIPSQIPSVRQTTQNNNFATARPGTQPTEGSLVASGAVTLATRTQFGLDLGSENTMTGLRLRWQRLSERHKASLSRLEPLIAVRDGTDGLPILYLVAGPIADAAEAASLCAQLRQGNIACQTAPYDGQKLDIR